MHKYRSACEGGCAQAECTKVCTIDFTWIIKCQMWRHCRTISKYSESQISSEFVFLGHISPDPYKAMTKVQ